MPATDLISVDFPAPLSPTSAITWPSRTSKSTSASAWTEPNDFEIPRSSRIGAAALMAGFLPQKRGGGGIPGGRPHPNEPSYLQYFLNWPMQTWFFFRKSSLKRWVEFFFG